MERHKCKLCSRTFANGRALGGHMKGHFSTLPLPPKPEPEPEPVVSIHSDNSASLSYSTSSSEEEEEEKGMIYELRENPKKSFRLADPKFSFLSDTGSVVQDRESETESKNPTRKRSKRSRKFLETPNKKKGKLSLMMMMELSPPVSSVSETWPEEDVAMCLMMLSRDTWKNNKNVAAEKEQQQQQQMNLKEEEKKNEMKLKRVSKKQNKCDKCGKTFRSSRALGSHKSICSRDYDNDKNKLIFECPFCYKVFGSGQALGGHKRSHLIPSSSSNNANNNNSTTTAATRFKDTFIDLNLPAQPEEDDLSVVSDA